ncbi:hypothetical protein JZU61_06475, partial [bacterium]|nr:hypothetical protein [bacterium]
YNIETVKKLNYPAIDVNYTALMSSGIIPNRANAYGLFHKAHVITFSSIPIPVSNSQFAETQAVPYISKVALNLVTPFFSRALYAHSLVINYWFQFYVTDRYVGSYPWNVQIIRSRVGVTEPVEVIDLGGFGRTSRNNLLEGETTVSVDAGDELRLVVQSPGIDAHYMAYVTRQQIKISEAVVSSPATTTEGLPVYEVIERL